MVALSEAGTASAPARELLPSKISREMSGANPLLLNISVHILTHMSQKSALTVLKSTVIFIYTVRNH
jgi:hypothetical protein